MQNPFDKYDKKQVASRFKAIEGLILRFTFAERIAFYTLSFILLISAYSLFSKLNDLFLVSRPISGGSFTEGIIGSPRFVNPLLAVSDADRDLTGLIYSGLLRAESDGSYTPDLAESYSVSDNGLTYDFILRDGATFHDGTAVTTDDVEFTIMKAKDPALKSPKRASWDGVEVEKVSPKEIKLHLKQPYAPFLGNTTLGILPKHLWKDLSEEEFTFSIYNSQKPIGSGPYKVSSVSFNPDKGLPESYTLESFGDLLPRQSFIQKIVLKFFTNEDALVSAYKGGDIDSFGGINPKRIVDEKLEKKVLTAPLPRIFGVFFNQNEAAIFTRSEVREALDMVVDRESVIENALYGFGVPIDSPFPPNIVPLSEEYQVPLAERIASAQELLEKKGWNKNTEGVYELTTKKGTGKNSKQEKQTLSFSLSTSNATELKATAEILKKNFEAVGAKVELNYFELGDLTLNVIRERKYQALLYGEVVGRDLDLYAFWHSNQRNDPGLNIALYTNKKVDDILTKTRTTSDIELRSEKFQIFLTEIRKDRPAIFLYSPEFIYIPPTQVKNISLESLSISSERFLHIRDWYIETEKIWKWFERS